MNQRIKLLAEQAGFILFSPEEDPSTPIDWSCDYDCELQKFAQLIVKDCVGIVENLPPGYIDYRNQIEDYFRFECVRTINRYFGIEDEDRN